MKVFLLEQDFGHDDVHRRGVFSTLDRAIMEAGRPEFEVVIAERVWFSDEGEDCLWHIEAFDIDEVVDHE